MANSKKHVSARGGASISGQLEKLRAVRVVGLEKIRAGLRRGIDKARSLMNDIGEHVTIYADLSAQVESLIASAKSQYSDLLKAREIAEQDKENYRLEHMLSCNPHQPFVMLECLKLACAGLGETFINAGFLAQAHMVASPIAALTVSGLISLTNISLSCVGGFYIQRYIHFGAHTANPEAPEYKRVRIRAKTQRIVFIGLMIGFTLTIGLVRSQARLEEIEHSLSAYITLLTTTEALLLMATSACISVFTYFKATTAFSDPYPGFSTRQAALDEADEALVECREEWTEKLEAPFDEQIEAIERDHKASAKARKQLDKAVKESTEQLRKLEKQTAIAGHELRAECTQLISEFKSRGGKLEPGFNLTTHCDFQTLLADLEIPEPPATTATDAALQEAKLNKAVALAQLAKIFTH